MQTQQTRWLGRTGNVDGAKAAFKAHVLEKLLVQVEEVKGGLGDMVVGASGCSTWETKAARDARHNCRDKVVQVAKGRHREFEGAEANVVERFVVQDHALVGVFHQLVHREGCIVRLHHGVRHLHSTQGR